MQIPELFYESFINGIKIIFPVFIPYIVIGIIMFVVTCIIKRGVYDYNILIGNGKRKARKNAKRAGDFVDLISAVNDISKK